MKNILKIIGILTVIFSLASCSDENLLDKTPFNKIAESEAFSSPENIRLSVVGMYENAAIGLYTGAPRGFVWGGAWVQQNDNRGEDVVNMASFYKITYEAEYNSGSANNVYYWADGYSLINRANLIIEGVTNAAAEGIITQEEADDYIGQAKFFRGITLFELNKMYSRPYSLDPNALGAIISDTPVNTEEGLEKARATGRSKVSEVYEFVLNDLTEAEKKIKGLHWSDELHVSSDAAIAFKTRVYLHMRDWPNVIAEANKLDGKYALTEAPSGVFDQNLGNGETIFSIEQTGNSNAGVNGALGSQYGRRELVAISPIIWNNAGWLKDDKRRATVDIDALKEENPKYAFDPMSSEGIFVRKSGKVLYTNKYRDYSTLSDKSPLIRYAEVLLNRSEALARTGKLDDALIDLNKVRDRALANPTAQSYKASDLATDKSMVEAIILERRIEFLMEGNRYSDIHRLQKDDLAPIDGIPAKVENGKPIGYDAASGVMPTNLVVKGIPYDDFRFIWPIPNTEEANNPGVKGQQNPGY